MPYLDWDENLRVNIPTIDDQHLKLFEMINNLHIIVKSGQGDKALKPLIYSLVKYVNNHFADEEKWMNKYDYPEIEKHKEEHMKYISNIKDFIKKYENNSPLLARDILISLANWYREHIIKIDKKFGAYLNAKNIVLET
ncbi:bacteriohemerythrin [Candidatus Latescibacterota bacterium]